MPGEMNGSRKEMSRNIPSGKRTKETEDDMIRILADSRLTCSANVQEFQESAKFKTSFKNRLRVLAGEEARVKRECKGVMCWLWRDKRVQDNWALLHSQARAMELNVPLHVLVIIPAAHAEYTIRHYTFLLEGLKEMEDDLSLLGIPFHLVQGDPCKKITRDMLESLDIGLLITDFSPLREHKNWIKSLEDILTKDQTKHHIAIHQVDAHNVVPVWEPSDKQEYAARTIRPKIEKNLGQFLTPFPPLVSMGKALKGNNVDWEDVYNNLKVDTKGFGVETVTDYFEPGTIAGHVNLSCFVKQRLKLYGNKRNDPNISALSNLSPWVNHGQISMQRCVLYIKEHGSHHGDSVKAFVEEAVVRKELSDNFCLHNPNYDSIEGASNWAQITLNDHKKDKRDYLYSREQLECGRTHDDLWNAAQLQLVKEGKMHGFLRMYWAKKVLEWTESPETALKEALRLNDRYALDGNDPNGFVGVMWSIAGIHDQGWAERNVFGKIRYMNYNGCKRKFDINKFVIKYGAKVHT